MSSKMTVPLGVPAPCATAATVTVKVTDWPKTLGLAEEVTVVVVAAELTTWEIAGEMLIVKLESPS